MGACSQPPGLSSPSTAAPPLLLPSPPSSSTVPFSWEKQPGVPKSRQHHKVEKAIFLPLPLPPAPPGSSRGSTPSSNNSLHHAPGGHATCRKKQHHYAGQQHVHLARLFPAVVDGRGQTKVSANGGDNDDPFSLALARCAEEARRPATAPFRLPSPPPRRRTSSASKWGNSSKTKSNRSGGSATRGLSSAFRPLDLYGSCRSSGVSCRSSVVQSTVSIPQRRSTSDVVDCSYSHGGPRHNRQYVAYAILYGRHG